MKTLELHWKEFQNMVNPRLPIEAKDAFFSGAAMVLSILNTPGASFDSLVNECVEFSNDALLDNVSNDLIQ